MHITISEKAEKMLQGKLEEGQFLRVAVTQGGCAGLTYSAAIATEMNSNESVVHAVGTIHIVTDGDSVKYLDGLVIDYSDDLINGGLQFTNANTGNTCGCGQSFSLAGFPTMEGGKCST